MAIEGSRNAAEMRCSLCSQMPIRLRLIPNLEVERFSREGATTSVAHIAGCCPPPLVSPVFAAPPPHRACLVVVVSGLPSVDWSALLFSAGAAAP